MLCCRSSAPAPLYPPLSVQSTVPAPNFAMPVTVPVTNQNTLQFSNPGSSLVTQSLVTSSLTDPRLLSPQQPALQRNTVSPGLPQRPASAGEPPCAPLQPHLLILPASLGLQNRAWRVPEGGDTSAASIPHPGSGFQLLEHHGRVVAPRCALLPDTDAFSLCLGPKPRPTSPP